MFGAATTMMMMPLMLMREQIWSRPISMETRECSQLPTLLKLLRELIEGLVGKHKSIHQPCGAVVLMAKWSTYH
jgi:cytochrome b